MTGISLKDNAGQTVSSVATATDGSFEFRSLVPGRYTISASIAGSDETRGLRLVGRSVLDVGERDVDNVAFVLQPGYTVPGQVFMGSAVADGDALPGLRVELRTIPWEPQLSSNFPYGPSKPAADGSFSLPGVLPGIYRVAITGMPPNRYVKTATYGATEVLDLPLQFDPAASNDLRIVIGIAPPPVEVIVKDAKDNPAAAATVVLVPSAPHRDRTDMYRSAVTDASGRAAISNLVPGEYQAFAFVNFEPGASADPEFLRLYGDRGRRLQVGESGSEAVELSVIPTN
jgi:hypothetical protein